MVGGQASSRGGAGDDRRAMRLTKPFVPKSSTLSTKSKNEGEKGALARDSLPPQSCWLKFQLLPTVGPSSALVACVSCNLPWRPTANDVIDPSERPSQSDLHDGHNVLDWSRGTSQATVQVIRLVDPEPRQYREPFVSLARIFVASGLTPTQGLLMFPEVQIDSTIAGLAPFVDLWVSLDTARKVATQLNRLDELAGLLEWDTRKAFSVHDKEQDGLVHKLDPQAYSTRAMLAVTFPRIHMLPSSTQIRTLMPDQTTFLEQPSACPTSFETLLSHLVNWSVIEHEAFIDVNDNNGVDMTNIVNVNNLIDNETTMSTSGSTLNQDLLPSLLFTTLLSFLSLTNVVTLSHPIGHVYDVIPNKFRIDREQVVRSRNDHVSSRKVRIGLVDAICRIVLNEWRRLESNKQSDHQLDQLNMDDNPTNLQFKHENINSNEIETRLKQLELELKELKQSKMLNSGFDERLTQVEERLDLTVPKVINLEQSASPKQQQAHHEAMTDLDTLKQVTKEVTKDKPWPLAWHAIIVHVMVSIALAWVWLRVRHLVL
ncbi:hypothetical protein OIO90_005118 [Microbotryomycetes sp. JL221]|nr:hypothetical protein OIO90_005118 [Microbotryomycetes sp. JL221]